MANMIVPQDAEIATISNLILNLLSSAKMHLFGSAITVSSATTLANCTAAEATFAGYAPVFLPTWSTPVIDGSGAAASTTQNGVFTNTGGVSTTVYGMFLTDGGPSLLYGAEQYSAPIAVPAGLGFQDILTYTVLSRY